MKVGERKSERSPLFHLFGEEKGVKRGLFGESGESFGERSTSVRDKIAISCM